MIRRYSFLLLGLLLCYSAANSAELEPAMASFVTEMVNKHGLDRNELTALLAKAKHRQDIIDAMNRPAERKPWYQYRPIFVTGKRIQGGVTFWRQNAALLDKISAQYGVPPEIIVAIIGVETRYGGYLGKHRILDSLTTLAFHYPKRADFFRSELEQFLLLTREEQIDPLTAKGSYAGAMGKPQFIASSYRRYAIDYDRDQQRDLWQSNADIIASVANYFVRHGWKAGEPIAFPATGVQPSHQNFVAAGMEPSLWLAQLKAVGIQPSTSQTLADQTMVSLLEFENEDAPEYWLGLKNFYVITRYNHSQLYAMAVYQLSQKIKQAYQSH